MELNNHVPIVMEIPPHVEHLCHIKELKDVSVSLKVEGGRHGIQTVP